MRRFTPFTMQFHGFFSRYDWNTLYKYFQEFLLNTLSSIFRMKSILLTLLALLAWTEAQIPGIGWCPDKRSMPNFDIERVSTYEMFH